MELRVGRTYDVTVIKILNVGAVVELEDGTTELIHISNIADEYIDDVCDYVSVGKHYSAVCKSGTVRLTELSLKHLNLQSQAIEPNPSSHIHRNIDDMIRAADCDYLEKSRSRNKRYKRKVK